MYWSWLERQRESPPASPGARLHRNRCWIAVPHLACVILVIFGLRHAPLLGTQEQCRSCHGAAPCLYSAAVRTHSAVVEEQADIVLVLYDGVHLPKEGGETGS